MRHSSIKEDFFSVKEEIILPLKNMVNDPHGAEEDAAQNLPWFRTHGQCS